jgi:hypothetical protein
MEGGQGRQFDSSCDRPALPYSFFAPGGALPPSHATSQPQLFYYYIHIYLRSHHKSTHSLSIPAIFRFHFTSFGNTTYCIYPPYITALSSSPSIPRNPNQAYPRDSILPQFRFRHEAISSRIGQFPLYNRPRLAYAGNMPDCRHSIQTNLTASDKLGHRFFSLPLWDGRGKEKVEPRPRRRSCIVVLNTFIVPAHPRDMVPLDVLRYDTCKLNTPSI